MLPLIMAACGAAGAVAGVVTTCAAKEQDKQAIKRYEKVNAELINSRDKLQQRYYELTDRSKQQINELNLKLAESEMEKDVVYLALELYQELMGLRENIDIHPSFEVLVEFHKAIVLTNYVLKQLDRRLVPVNQDYFSRTLTRIDERDNLSKEQLFSFMAVLMNPQQDTVTSLLGEVQNEMFSQPTMEVEEQDTYFDKTIDIETDNEDDRRLQDENQWNQTDNAGYQELFLKVQKVVVEQLEVEKDRVTPETSFANDLGADSLDTVELVMALEEEFDIEIPDEVAEQVETVGKAVKLIAAECGIPVYSQQSSVIEIQNEMSPEESAIEKEKTISSIFDEVKDWGERGEKLFDLDYYEEAITCYKKAIKADPDNDEYWCLKSLSLGCLGQNEEALQAIEKALNLNPENDMFWEQKSEVLLYLDRNKEALQAVEEAIFINPDNDFALYLKGKLLLILEDNEAGSKKALQTIEKALDINPKNDEAWYWQSKALYRLDKFNEALASVNKAIALESNDDRYYFLQSCVLDDLNLNKESLNSIDKAIGIDPENSLYWYSKSGILFSLEEYKKALFSINKAINFDSKDSDYWAQKSLVTLNLEKYSDSLTCADKAIALNPTNDWYWYQKSRALYLLDREKEAFKALDQAIAIDPDDETYRNFRDEMVEYLTNKTEEPVGIVDNVLGAVFSFFD